MNFQAVKWTGDNLDDVQKIFPDAYIDKDDSGEFLIAGEAEVFKDEWIVYYDKSEKVDFLEEKTFVEMLTNKITGLQQETDRLSGMIQKVLSGEKTVIEKETA